MKKRMATNSRFKILSYLLLFVFTTAMIKNQAIAQNMVFTAQTGQQLVDSLLGGGIVATNVSYTGHSQSKAAFTSGSTIGFPIDKGILLSTGFYTNVAGWNTSGATSDYCNANSDPDLQALITASSTYTSDACVLEFDFVATSDSIQFDYIFASEEYPEFACGGFNDVFAFMLSGTNPSGGTYVKKNLALIPGTTTYVSVNSVNAGVYGSMGAAANCSSIDPNWASYNVYYNDNPKNMNVMKIKPDGYTDIFTAKAAVVSGQTYHIKLAIADVGYYDQGYDSYVFIKAKSFVAPGMNVALTANPSTVCAGSPVQLNATVTNGVANYTYAWSSGPTNSNITTDTNSIYVTPAANSTYTVTVTGSNGLTASASVNITISSPATANISYAGSPFCKTLATAQAVTLTGTGTFTGGTYTSTPAGLTLNAATGAITPSTSTAGVYTVTYTIASAGGCSAVTATASVTITTAPTASISYAGPFCSSNATAQAVTLTGTAGGTYTSSPAGLTINAATGAITPSTSTVGVYTITYTIAASGGCAAVTATASVTITAAPTANISYAGSPFCKTLATAQAVTLTGTGTFTGGTYTSTPAGLILNAATGAITPSTSTAGVYTVTYTIASAGGCSAVTATASVTITTAPTASISYAGPFCSSNATAQAVTLTGTSGGTYTSSPAGLTINAATGAITPSTSTAGVYTVTYTIAASGGCAAVTATASITITAAPTANIGYSSAVFCTTVVTAQNVTLIGAGTFAGGTYTSSPAGLGINAATGAITPNTSTPGAYIITYSIPASGGCGIVMATANVSISNAPTASISYAGSPFCSSLITGQAVTLTGTSGGTYTSSPAGLTINASTGAIIPNTSTAGNYTVTYTIPASGGCLLVTATTNITITTAPNATINYAGAPFCSSLTTGQAVTLTGTAGGTYTSSPAGLAINAATGAITPSTSTAGIYTITYTIPASNGCALVAATANVTITTAPTASISYTGSPFCTSLAATQTVTLTGTTGGTYTSSPAGLTIGATTGAITPSTSTAGNYTVTYTIPAAGGCALVSATANVTITAAPTASINYAGSPFCSSLTTPQSVTLTGTAGGTYSSAPAGLTINTATGGITPSTSTAGNYVITYTIPASNGCALVSATANVTITTAPTASISYTGSPFCTSLVAAQTVTLTGTTGGTYTSSPAGLTINAATGAIIPNTSTSGNYTVTYTIPAAGGCALVSATANVTITAAPTASINYAGSPFCSSLTTPQAVTLTGTAGGTYSSVPAGLTINAATGAITPSTSTAGNYTITYTIPASNGCALVSATANITITTAPTASISYTGSPFCTSITTSQLVTLTGTTGGIYSSIPAGLSINTTTGSVIPSASTAGNYTVTYTIPAGGGCAPVSVQTVVTINANPTIIISGNAPVCRGSSLTLTATGASSYVWSSAEATSSITFIPTGNGPVSVTGTLAGCQNSATLNIVINELPVVTISGVDTICNGQSTTLTATGATSYQWSHGASGSVINVFPATTTTYIVTGTSNGCTDAESFTVVILPKPIISFSLSNPTCGVNNGEIQAIVSGTTGTYSYDWGIGQTINPILNLAPGNYNLTVSDGFCSAIGNATLLNPNIDIQAGMNITPRYTTILEGDVIFHDASTGGVVDWDWTYGDGTSQSGFPVTQHHYSEVGTYLVTLVVHNSGGCSDTIQDSVIVEEVFTLYVPNAFSPDDNSNNEGFYAVGNAVDPNSFSMDIYDRWGGLIFRTDKWVDNRSYPAWNGAKMNSGEVLPIGVYVYRILVTDLRGKQHVKAGNVNIIK